MSEEAHAAAAQAATATAQAVNAAVKAERVRQFDLDVRGAIALLAIAGGFALAFVQLFLKGNADIPAWAAGVVGSVVGFYFGGRMSKNGRNE